jgi:drug/metabolite transporter (DMT)-like permease
LAAFPALIRPLGVAAYGAPVLSTLILVAVGLAQPTVSLALACALIVAGAFIASWRQGAQKKGRR